MRSKSAAGNSVIFMGAIFAAHETFVASKGVHWKNGPQEIP